MEKPKIPVLTEKDKEQLRRWAKEARENAGDYRIVPHIGTRLHPSSDNFKTLDLYIDRGNGLEAYFTGEYGADECRRRQDKIAFHLTITPELILALLGEPAEKTPSKFYTLLVYAGGGKKQYNTVDEVWKAINALPKGALYEVYDDKNVRDWQFAPENKPKVIPEEKKKSEEATKAAPYNVSINAKPPIPCKTAEEAKKLIADAPQGSVHLVTDANGRVRTEFIGW